MFLRKRRQFALLIGLLMLSALLAGCANGVEGTWYHATDVDKVETLTLKSNNSFITDYSYGGAGEWEENEDTVILAMSLGSLTLNVTEKDGERVLQHEDDLFYSDKEVALEAYKTEQKEELEASKASEREASKAAAESKKIYEENVQKEKAALTEHLVGTWKAVKGYYVFTEGSLYDADDFIVEFKSDGTHHILKSPLSGHPAKGDVGTFEIKSDGGITTDLKPNMRLYIKHKNGDGVYDSSGDFGKDVNEFYFWSGLRLKKVD